MTTMTPTAGHVTGGVDTHADMHVAAAIDQVGGVLGTATFATTPVGYRRLLAWLQSHGQLRERLRELKTRELLEACRGFRVRADDDSLAGTTRLVLRELAQRIAMLDEQLTDTMSRLRRITSAVASDLVAKHGIGPDTASTLLVVAGDNPHRLNSERSFAALLGSSPIPATSGKRQNRHRLNRGGDRQGNAALAHRDRPHEHRPDHARLRR